MPIFEYGNMFDILNQTDLFCITTNASIRTGRLSMGKGIALEAKKKFPELPRIAGAELQFSGMFYGFRIVYCDGYKFGLFQTKDYARYNSNTYLISDSLRHMLYHLRDYENRNGKPYSRVDLNYPGIGEGGLNIKHIFNRVNTLLPPYVHVWVNREDQYREILELCGNR